MRFIDIAIDLGAVLSASRSVGAKHVALRGRQLEKLSRTSSFVKTRQPTAPPYTAEAASSADDAQAAAEAAAAAASSTASATATASATLSTSNVPKDAISRTVHVPHSSPIHAAGTTFTQASGAKPESGSVLSHLREEAKASGSPWSDASPFESKPATAQSGQATATTTGHAAPGTVVEPPPDVDFGVFHTKRGSSLLGDLAERKKTKPAGLPEFVTHSQEPRTPKSVGSAKAASSGPEIKWETKYPESAPLPVEPEQEKRAEPTAAALNAAVAPAQPAATPSPESSVRPYVLRESKVPSSRFGRIWNYGGLAAGMMGGALSEGLGRAFGGSGEGSVFLSAGNMERLVSKLSQMRGAALKLGQMISFQDTKMLPAPLREVLQRVQDRADYMPAWQRDRVLTANLGAEWRELFGEFEDTPIAAASIGQVHRATLKDGRRVAVKIQFPGVADSINSDLDNLSILLTATKLLPKGLYLNKTIDNARLELGWECDYEREAACATRYRELLGADEDGDVFAVPRVYPEASGKQVLTMDFMDGVGVTRVTTFTQEQRDWIGTQVLRLCLRELTEFRFMQTDPNWTNFLYNAGTGKLELLDFGASREFPDSFVTKYVELLAAASRTDRDRLRTLSIDLGYLTGHESRTMVDAHVQSILTLAEPFLDSAPEVYDFEGQTITERVKALIPVMLNERLAPPPEETYSLHRKLSGAFLLCAKLGSKVPCRQLFADSLKANGYL